jgi:hypothetical protein
MGNPRGVSADPVQKRRINNKSLRLDDESSSDDEVANVSDESVQSNAQSRIGRNQMKPASTKLTVQ